MRVWYNTGVSPGRWTVCTPTTSVPREPISCLRHPTPQVGGGRQKGLWTVSQFRRDISSCSVRVDHRMETDLRLSSEEGTGEQGTVSRLLRFRDFSKPEDKASRGSRVKPS